jgi:BMFP domain-containing protein YqiC
VADIKRLKSEIERLEAEASKTQEALSNAQLEMARELNKWHCGTTSTKKDFELAEEKMMPIANKLSLLLAKLNAVKKDLESAIKDLDMKN